MGMTFIKGNTKIEKNNTTLNYSISKFFKILIYLNTQKFIITDVFFFLHKRGYSNFDFFKN